MFGRGYFSGSYFGAGYFGSGPTGAVVPGATAAQIWAYTLSNGLSAGATLVAVHAMLSELHLIHGLTLGSPLAVTDAARTAGPVSQTISEGGGTVTVTRT
jgi:hypothetical protein